MANTLNAQFSIVTKSGNMGQSTGASISAQPSSSFVAGQTLNVDTGSWKQLATGSISDVSVMAFYNDNSVNSGSKIQIASGSAGQYPITTLQPGYGSLISWSGSFNGLYAKVVDAAVPVVNGTLEYVIQPS